MKKYLKILLPMLLVIAAIFVLVSCGGGGGGGDTVSYKVTYDADGGNFHRSEETVTAGEFLTRPGEPTRLGYDFAGWYLGDTEFAFNTPITSDITLTARWERSVYTVSFDTDGANEIAPLEVYYGEKISAPEVTKEFHTLDKWYNGGEVWHFETSTVTSNITLRASWTREQATVVFDKNYDTSDPTFSIKVNKGGPVSERDFSRTGYEIEGWYTKDGEKWDFTSPVTSDITLYANWVTAVYTITFDASGQGDADGLTEVSVSHGECVTEPETPVRDGYVFAGWYWDSSFSRSGLYTFNQPVAYSYTLYAKWVKNEATEGLVITVDESGDFAYVSGYSGDSRDVVIPATYEGVPVKSVMSYALSNKRIEFLYIPKSVTVIGERALADSDLFCVVIEDGSKLEVIEASAFEWCEYLRIFKFGENSALREIKDSVFYECESLFGITLPSGIEYVSPDAFYKCGPMSFCEFSGAYYIGTEENPYFFLYEAKNQNITELTVHEDTRVIARSACMSCKNITSITIPEGVKAIGLQAFSACSSVTEIYYYATEAEDIDYKYAGAFKVGTSTAGATLYIGGNVKRIPASMFSDSGKITEVVFLKTQLGPDEFSTENLSLTSIGEYAFYECGYLTSFEITYSLEQIGDNAFSGCNKLVHIINRTHFALGLDIVAGSEAYGRIALNAIIVTDVRTPMFTKTDDGFVFLSADKNYLVSYEGTEDTITLPSFFDGDKPYVINKHAFSNMVTEFKSITVPQGITEIPSMCFIGTEIESVTVSNTVKIIGSYAFKSTRLKQIVFEAGCTLEQIQDYAFDATSLEKFVIPKSVKRLGNVFISYSGNSGGITTVPVVFEDGSEIEFVSVNSFAYCTEGNFTVDSHGGKYIGSESNPYLVFITFTGSAPESYTVADGARTIALDESSSKFYNVRVLTLPESMVYVPYISLNSYTLNLSDTALLNRLVRSIAEHEGANRNILVKATAINVGGEPLKNLVIEEGITEIWSEIFSGVTSIQTVSLPSTLVRIGDNAFAGCTGITEITLREGITYASLNSMSGLKKVYINAKNAVILMDSGEAEIIIGSGVESLSGNLAGAASVDFAEGGAIAKLGENIFKGSKISEITIPGTITVIPSGAFANCESLVKVVISDGVKYIEKEAFNSVGKRNAETEITLPSTLISIGENAFVSSNYGKGIRIMNSDLPESCYYLYKGAFGSGVLNEQDLVREYWWYYIDENGKEQSPASPYKYIEKYDVYRKNTTITFVDENGVAIGEKNISFYMDGGETELTFFIDYEGMIKFAHHPETEITLVLVSVPDGYELPSEPIVITGVENTVVLKAKA